MLAELLRERFQTAEWWHLEGADLRELTDQESATVSRFERLGDTVEAVPPLLMQRAQQLAANSPERFEFVLGEMICRVGRGYFPDDAAAFVKALIGFLDLAESR